MAINLESAADRERAVLLVEDLSKSGLVPKDLGAYLAQETELAAVGIRPHMYLDTPGVGTPGYVIPYYDMNGIRAPFYRLKLFKPLPQGAKYLQPANSGSWVYFPKNFKSLLEQTLAKRSRSSINGFDPCLIICEGEKKATKACTEGFLTVGLGGVYNWRTKVLIMPKGTQLVKDSEERIVAKLQGGPISIPTTDKRAVLAAGLPQIIDLVKRYNMHVVIAFDTDEKENPQVQRACAELAFELRTAGITADHIRQLKLPSDGKKVGLDDFLVEKGTPAFTGILHDLLSQRSAYPRHPDLRALISSRLDNQITRNEARELGLLVLSDMDTSGIRMVEEGSGTPYYFDAKSKTLMEVNLLHHHGDPLHESRFGEFLYREYDISQGDSRLLTWVAAGFTGEKPVGMVSPRSVLALTENNQLAVQLGDSEFAIISGDTKKPLRIVDNGSDGILFRANQVEPLDPVKLQEEFTKQIKWLTNPGMKFEDLYWVSALKQFKFVRPQDATIMAILMYMSPWLLRWNGTQLPVELTIGEPGSGKSSMYSLRLQILTGRPALRNQPTDIRDWYASITGQDGLHVIDNLHFATKEIRQRLSDEICRIVTEPKPFIEMRRLFTTSEVARMPVRTIFAATAIQQPFINADILQRSIIFQLGAIGDGHDSDWATLQINKHGGREAWMAHHMAVLHLFFAQAGKWNKDFKSKHRLANFEQMFRTIGTILRMPQLDDISHSLVNVAEEQVSDYDWTMQAVKEFCIDNLPTIQKDPRKVVTCQDISQWCMAKEDFADNNIVTNARKLSRYIISHAFMVEKCTGLYKLDAKYGNRDAYRINVVKH